ncbi:MAG: membrane protein YczE [Lacisediminihabitans sp.]
MTPRLLLARRIAQLLVGLFLYGIAISMMIRAGIGVSPWDVLAQGVSKQTGIPFGWVTNIIGLGVLLLWIPIRQRPGIGTLLNALLIGPSAEVGLALIPAETQPWAQLLVFAGGLALVAVATGLYIGAGFGPGPRDGLMTGINRRWGWRIWIVRTSIEVTVLSIGWFLGGNVGLGTVAFALLIGPMVGVTLPLLRVPSVPVPQSRNESTPSRDTEAAFEVVEGPLEGGSSF